MFGDSGMKMLLGALGIPPEALDAIPKMAADFQNLATAFQAALVNMEERQRRIESMVTELLAWTLGQSNPSTSAQVSYPNGRDTIPAPNIGLITGDCSNSAHRLTPTALPNCGSDGGSGTGRDGSGTVD